jgi:Holliday junction DNA helicase RuvA
MIGKIKGKLIETEGNKGLIETNSGLSYEVVLVPSIISKYPVNSNINLYSKLIIREDSQTLYGFEFKEQVNFFNDLLSISGVGPKLAFTVISFSNKNDIVKAVKSNDVDFFVKIPGLGKKTSLKIIVELSSKLEADVNISKLYLNEEDKTVLDALVSLGFKLKEAKEILGKIPKKGSIEERIKQGLRYATSNKKKL